MKYLLIVMLTLAGCCDHDPSRDLIYPDSKLQVHYIVGGGLLIIGPDYRTIILEDGSVLIEIKNHIDH